MISIPLLKFSTDLSLWPVEKNGPEWGSFPAIRVKDHELGGECYGVEIEDESMSPVLKKGMVAIFSQATETPALMNIFSIGRKGDGPLVRKVVRNEIPPNEIDSFTGEGSRRLRKSFMTPTPLHIPGSRVSPIAESTHQTIFMKSLRNPEKLTLVPKGNLLWMHPLVLILNPGEFK
jgi:hypothetical protein